MSSKRDDCDSATEPDIVDVLPAAGATKAEQPLVTRTRAARHMGVSVATLRRMEGNELNPVIIDGKHYFALEELEQYRRVSAGELAAKAFEMFNADQTQVDVVIALKESPERIQSLFRSWVEMSDCIVAGSPGIGGRRLHELLKFRLTRRIVWLCLNAVLGNLRIPVAFDHRFRRHSISRSDRIRSAIPTIRSPVPTT